jgi:hypothetical protein
MSDYIFDDNFLFQNQRASLKSRIPALKDNKTWQNTLLPRLVRVRQKGTGVGELLLSFMIPGVEYRAGKDLVVNNKSFELKSLMKQGCMKATNESGFRATDKARKDILNGKDPLEDEVTEEQRYEFFKEIWPNIDKGTIKNLVAARRNLSKKAYKNYIGGEIYKSYQKIDGFDSILLVDENPDTLDIISIVDIRDTNFINDNVIFTPMFRRGGDTNAVGDGYCKIKGTRRKK